MPTIWLYGNTSRTIADAFHEWSGWAMYLVSLVLLFVIIRALKWAMLPLSRFPLASQYA
jgi:hypothetical protein